MQHFTNILVGVDLTDTRRTGAPELRPVARGAVDHASWLARISGARLLFFSALHTTEAALRHLEDHDLAHVARTVEERAHELLTDLAAEAEQQGVAARCKLAAGEPWREIAKQVLREHHDLVVVGTGELSSLGRRLMGSTAHKLLRVCPCPVWVTRLAHAARPQNTLIATDFHPAAQSALALGLALGEAAALPVHVLHVVEYPLDRLWTTGLPDDTTTRYHRKVSEEAAQALLQELRRVGQGEVGPGIQAHLVEGAGLPDLAIQHFIRQHHIDLLVMGTVARGGIAGIMIGNTAERLLPEVACSIVAVKPPDFHCPVTLH